MISKGIWKCYNDRKCDTEIRRSVVKAKVEKKRNRTTQQLDEKQKEAEQV